MTRVGLAVLVVVAWAASADAGEASRACRLECDAAVARCTAVGAAFGIDERVCRRKVLRRCKRLGVGTCSPAGLANELPADHPLAGIWLLSLDTCTLDCRAPGDFTVDCEHSTASSASIVRFVFDAGSSADLDLLDVLDGGHWLGGTTPWFGSLADDEIRFDIPRGSRPSLSGTLAGDRISVRLVWNTIIGGPVLGCPVAPAVGELRRIPGVRFGR